jgi:hypothetical protein
MLLCKPYRCRLLRRRRSATNRILQRNPVPFTVAKEKLTCREMSGRVGVNFNDSVGITAV